MIFVESSLKGDGPMLYTMKDNLVKKIEVNEIDPKMPVIGYVDVDGFADIYKHFNVDELVLRECLAEKTHFRSSIDIYENFTFGLMNLLEISKLDRGFISDKVAFFITKYNFILIELYDEDHSVSTTFETAMNRYRQTGYFEKLIYDVFESFLLDGNDYFEKTQKRILEMEKNLVEGKINQNFNKEIFKLRNELSVLKNYYEKMFLIGESLYEDENELFDPKRIGYFKNYMDKVERYIRSTTELNENLVHLREAIDASLNYNLNSVMKLFTVVTTIFMPLTLIVGWYGMNFENMPELAWKYGYLMVGILSVAVIAFSIFLFKRKKLL